MATEGFRLGQFKAECQRCSSWYHSSKLKREWTGLRVCRGPGTKECWEPRHPLDFVRGVKDRQAPPWTSPPAEERFTSVVGDVSEDDL